ncbi:Poly-beta-1,6-N-acetyl-D-glucosamine synthase [Kordia antarctica]|uniref:Poly-beta-1,6-N-acetyl-D-glucosamine synthase n=1 Tax=Kordia antarctica TaxID=1218801 RepID=A0A7L4ZJL6_9FLAO|nr:glycosyltransferase family 2 protein [Kordia antarctica]QHI36667.1 Poly-beta-1,6-N-acetyl-D-glucosamine synthase [Kordia antarctica]
MNYYMVIPAHNEEAFIQQTLTSIVQQTLLPKKVVVVNDNSSDATERIIDEFTNQHAFITKVNTNSTDEHLPGSKVINAFYKGFETLDADFDIIVKLDADIILPNTYFEIICGHFKDDSTIGVAGGLAYIEKNGTWIYETIADKNHVRGPFKAYRKACFEQIGGLQKSLGWDTADVLLARFYNWKVHVDKALHVKHLKPTGNAYKQQVHNKHGEVFYKLGYGFWISLISSFKIALKKKSFSVFIGYMNGFFAAKKSKIPKMVTPAQADFIRTYRRTQMLNKLKQFFFIK